MLLTNEKLINDSLSLSQLGQKELPIKVSYAIAKNMTKIQAELDTYNKERQKLIDKYAQRDDNGKIIMIKDNQVQLDKTQLDNWNKDSNELLLIENDISIHKFPLSALEGNNHITPSELMAISYMIEEGIE